MNRRRQHPRGGFTVTELQVVIGFLVVALFTATVVTYFSIVEVRDEDGRVRLVRTRSGLVQSIRRAARFIDRSDSDVPSNQAASSESEPESEPVQWGTTKMLPRK